MIKPSKNYLVIEVNKEGDKREVFAGSSKLATREIKRLRKQVIEKKIELTYYIQFTIERRD